MAEAEIPVDLFNPGQVFACLGLLEAAEVLLHDAEGGFDWLDEVAVTFRLRAEGDANPVEVALRFLAEAQVVVVVPKEVDGPWPKDAEASEEFPAPLSELAKSDGKGHSASALPIRLRRGNDRISISSWLEGDRRRALKLFAGQQVGFQLASNMLDGDPKKPGTLGFRHLFEQIKQDEFRDPLDATCMVGGRFGYDARGSWDSIRAGTSLDRQGVRVAVAPHVELLAAIGLENARPRFLSTYRIQYTVWRRHLPLTLARLALYAPEQFLPDSEFKLFEAHLGDDKQYKKCFFARPGDQK